jgi:cob(I)alamin adenosyltransferase
VKIYTKTGDRGETGLIGGRRVSKASLRIEAYGTVDELNALLGVCVSVTAGIPDVVEQLIRIQNDLHTIGADLANPSLEGDSPRIGSDHVSRLESWCDLYDENLPPLTQFILPGGSPAGAQLHFARTVARRAERCVIALTEAEKINEFVVQYLNRLSDLLFLMSRFVNLKSNHEEINPDYV